MSKISIEFQKEMEQQIKEGNRDQMIATLTGLCEKDPGFQTGMFEEGLEYLENTWADSDASWELYDDFKETPALFAPRVESGDQTLGSNDFTDSVNHLQENFCHERMEDTKELGQFLHENANKQRGNVKISEENQNPQFHSIQGSQKTQSPWSVILKILGIVSLTVGAIFLLITAIRRLVD